ncbi:LacI family DNA-binding transcriptional regulator [Pseudomonas syringae]|uniref:Transcriptional regulator, LacI family protein n=1 Tax=Pseudomonas syringae pv. aceris TaxID=199198 RepID=A0A0L8IPV9_PSESX|nr:LacI family DNA-binding transcriptional regulator [Pseudomonas syringae]EGH71574.1 transcriptional regulator, LacI family protein [Pseudomonas syringae pv. aceris str. M302273]KOG03466.1 Transcriptional regulator, LacI family protein [Pseudomonas syringae pv. aceris]KPW19505.1 Transcriptional regulator, LacI family protein [Pseudomonas syringae pv. aceris]
MKKSFTTLDDVAAAAGMSRAQVSRALRGDPVRPETRERIAKIAAELNYRPNLAARSLVSAHSSIVGLLIGDPNNPFHIQLAHAIDRALLGAGFEPVTTLRSSEDGSLVNETERWLRLRAAGAILLAPAISAKAISTIGENLPCVYLGSQRISHPKVTVITVDDNGGVRTAIQHLLALGHRRIAHLGGGNEASARERTKAYCQTMEAAGLAPFFLRGTHDAASGRRGVDELFSDPQPPTAISASNDLLAMGVLDRLKGMGLSVPDDVSVIGFDDIPAASHSVFSLTTLRQDVHDQARTAVAALQDIIADKARRVRRHVMPVDLVIRNSSGPNVIT